MRNEIEDGMGCAGLVPTGQESSAEDAFNREREAYERLAKETDRLRCAIHAATGLLAPLGNQVIPSVMAIREALDILRRA